MVENREEEEKEQSNESTRNKMQIEVHAYCPEKFLKIQEMDGIEIGEII